MLKNLYPEFEMIIVPMTITNLQYYDEIVGRLERDGINIKQFILTASKENIISRLNGRGNSTKWAYKQVDRCYTTFKDDSIKGQKIDTNNKSVGEVCNNLIKLVYG